MHACNSIQYSVYDAHMLTFRAAQLVLEKSHISVDYCPIEQGFFERFICNHHKQEQAAQHQL